MTEDVLRLLSRLSKRQKVIGGTAAAYVLLLAVMGFILTAEFWSMLATIVVVAVILVLSVKWFLEYLRERKAAEFLAKTSEFLFAFLEASGNLPVPIKAPSVSELIRSMAEINFNKSLAIVKARLLLRSATSSENSAENCDLTRLWLLWYAEQYGKANNLAGVKNFPYFYTFAVEVSGGILQITIVIADNRAAAEFIKNPPQPPQPDPESYMDDELL